MFWTKLFTVMALVPTIASAPLFMLLPATQDSSVRESTHVEALMKRATAGQNTYSVVAGDTGYAIAAAWSITFDTLDKANPNVNWNNLQIGQNLNMPSNRNFATYTAQSGDNANSIGQEFNCYGDDVTQANLNADFNALTAGTVLRVPTYGRQTTYSVVEGDYGWIIAQAFGITFDTLSAANPGTNWPDLQIGQSLNIPAGASPSKGSLPSGNASPAPSPVTSTTIYTTTTSKTTITVTTTSTTTAQTTTVAAPTTTAQTTTVAAPTTTVAATTEAVVASTSSFFTAPVAAPSAVAGSSDSGVSSRPDAYTFYQGDGSTGEGWPDASQWVSFDVMWSRAKPYIGQSCGTWNVANNSPDETQSIYNAIQDIAATSTVDRRFIFAVIMQESAGCVRAPTTNYGQNNPGLMQDFNGKSTCNSKETGVINPCPESTIHGMIADGVLGTQTVTSFLAGGLVQDIAAQLGYSVAQSYYRAARTYNSGSVPQTNDLGAPGATRCYASDVANRLMGWVTAASTCKF